jgi:hypothetical protein
MHELWTFFQTRKLERIPERKFELATDDVINGSISGNLNSVFSQILLLKKCLIYMLLDFRYYQC